MSETLHELLLEIESLRIKQQDIYKQGSHPKLKRFTQQELNDEACKTYKNLLLGRSKRVPNRTTIMQIATYLECTLKQRNNLLILAGYLPEK